MFAVMKTGGKQYRVQSGDVLRVEKLDATAGETVQFNDVLMIGGDSPQVGTPLIDGAAVQAEVIDQIKGDKVIHFVKRRRKHGSQRKKGHRQQLTLLRVTEILPDGGLSTGVKAAIGAGAAILAGAAVAGGVAAARAARTEEAPAEAPKPKTAKAAPASEPPAPAASEAPAAEGTRPGNLLDAPREGGPDDLKKISGVGPKLEEKLHANGIFHFDQVAAWGPAEIAYMDDLLSFKGRIERDDWIGQATRFAAEKED